MLSRVDVTEEKKLAEKYDIQSLPGLVLFRKGDAIAYSGPREAQGMADWVEKKTKEGIIEIDKPGELQYIVEEEKIFVVGYISDRQDIRGIFWLDNFQFSYISNAKYSPMLTGRVRHLKFLKMCSMNWMKLNSSLCRTRH